MLRQLIAVGTALISSIVTGCAASSNDSELVVFAASSLTNVATDIAQSFENANDGVQVKLHFAGSSHLSEQIRAGAPADVVLLADERIALELVGEDSAESSSTFASNLGVLAVPRTNPSNVSGLADVGNAGLRVGLCAPEVPCGAIAEEMLSGAEVDASPDTIEPNVRSLLAKLASGELDVGIVYRSDIVAADGSVVEVPLSERTDGSIPSSTRYAAAILQDSPNRSSAASFVEFLRSDEAKEHLRTWDFEAL